MPACIIGVARKTWHPNTNQTGNHSPEPISMWEEVARMAAEDASAKDALLDLQSIDVVYCQSWQYDDPPGRLADRLGAAPKKTLYSGLGGSVPGVLCGQAMASIDKGDLDLSLIVGGEALATVRQLKKAGEKPSWSHKPDVRPPFPMDPLHPSEIAHQIFEAYLTFGLFDSAERAHANRSFDEHRAYLGEMLSPMTDVAASDPAHAWFPIHRSPKELITATPENRMVAYPYTKTMVAIMDIDMAAALLIASDEKADALGVPKENRVYLRGFGYGQDPPFLAQRKELWRSEAMAHASRVALGGLERKGPHTKLRHFDLYSCFASSLTFANNALQSYAPKNQPITVTGGLPYHGGPGSNYMTHALAAMVERLRADQDSYGLVSGVGMHMVKHAYALLSAAPGSVARGDETVTQVSKDITENANGPATIAAYTVMHDRDGAPSWAPLICDLHDGTRCYARMEEDLTTLELEEGVGKSVHFEHSDQGFNLAHLV